MSETLHSQNHVRIVVEMQSENNAISKSAKVKADTKTNIMRTVALNGLGLSVTVAVEQQKPIATNINQRIIGTMGKQKGEPMDKRIVMLVLILGTLTGCHSNRRPSVLIDPSTIGFVSRIDIGSKYEYVSFDVTETDTGKDVIVHFERRTDE